MVSVTITPSPHNMVYARRLREEGAAARQRSAYNAAARKAAKPLAEGVRTDLGRYMPHRGGYLGVLGGCLKTRILGNANGVTIRNTASGKHSGRDLGSLERGRLRHPVYGRRHGRRGQSLMRDTSIPPHFFTAPIKARADVVVTEVVKAMREIASRIIS